MSTIKISSLTELVALADPVEIPVAYLGVTKKVTARHFQGYVLGNLTVAGTTLGTNTSSLVIQLASDIVPTTDETYSLGSSVKKFKTIWVGTGSVYITDKTLGTNAELTVDNGVLKVNGANQLQVGQLKFFNNTIESTTGGTDIQIGLLTSSANLVLNRNVVIGAGKSLRFDDGPTISSNTTTMLVVDSNFTIGGDNILIVGDVDGEFNNVTVNGTIYNSQAVLSSTGSNFVGQLMLHRHSTTVQPILVSALSNSDTTDIDADIGYGQPLFQIAVTAWAGDDYKEFGGIVFSSEDMDGVTIGQSSSPGKILFNVTPDGQVGTNTAIAIRHDGTVEFSNGLILNPSQVPSTSKGNPGDRSGMFAVDSNNIYYCVENYSNGTVNIWKKTPLTGGTW